MGHRIPPIASSPDRPPLPVAMATKFGTKLAITRLAYEIFARFFCVYRGVYEDGRSMPPIAFFPTDPRCHGNEIRDKIIYNSASVRDICEVFASVGKYSEMGHQMLLTEFYPDGPLLPWQQNLRQNVLYLSLYNKYHCIWPRCGLKVWQLDDVRLSLPRPTLISRYNEQQRSRSSSSSRHIQRSVPTGGIQLCL